MSGIKDRNNLDIQNFLKLLSVLAILMVFIGVAHGKTIASDSEWREGDFNMTTVDTPQEPESLRIGYQNGTEFDDLNGYWRMDGGGIDYSGNSLDAERVEVSFIQGIMGTSSAEFNSNEENFIEVENDPLLNPDQFTLSTWVYKDFENDGEVPFLDKADRDGEDGYKLVIDEVSNTDRLSMVLYHSDGEERFTTEETVPTEEWIHVAATIGEGEVKLYINGEQKDLTSDSSEDVLYEENDESLFIGASNRRGFATYFDGRIDETKLHSRVLDEGEIFSEYFYGSDGVFRSDYRSRDFSVQNDVKWYDLETEASVSDSADPELEFNLFNETDSAETRQIQLESGENTYDLDVGRGRNINFSVDGTTTEPTEGWGLDRFTANYRFIELQSPDDGDFVLDNVARLDYITEFSKPGEISVIVNGTVEDTVSVDEGENDLTSEIELDDGFYEWRIVFESEDGEQFESERRTFDYEEANVAIFDRVPEEGERLPSDQEVEISYTAVADQETDLKLFLDDEVVREEQIDEDDDQTTFTYDFDLRSDYYSWRVEADYVDEDGDERTLVEDEWDFAVVTDIVVDSASGWSEGFFDMTSIDRRPNLNDLQAGMASPRSGLDNSLPLENLEGYWRMNNLDEVEDFSLNDNTGVTGRDTLTDDGIVGGNSFAYDGGPREYVQIADDPTLEDQSFTLSSWVFKEFQGDDDIPVMHKTDEGGGEAGYSMMIDDQTGEDRLTMVLYSQDQGEQRYVAEKPLDQGSWYHLAAVVDEENGEVDLYVNGEPQDLVEEDGSPVVEFNDQDLLIGADSTDSSGEYFSGRIDETKFFSEALGPQDVNDIAFEEQDGVYNTLYNLNVDAGKPVIWDRLRVENSITDETDLEAAVIPIGDRDTGQSFELDGSGVFRQLSHLEETSEAVFQLTSDITDISDTWVVEEFVLEYVEKFYNFQAEDIQFNDTNPNEGDTVEVDLSVSNLEDGDADVPVEIRIEQLFDGDYREIKTEEREFETSGEDQQTFTTRWETEVGPNRVTLEADPNQTIEETETDNNQLSETLDVPLYGAFYGNVEETVELEDEEDILYDITGEPDDGILYFIDVDGEFKINQLEPVTEVEQLETVDGILNSTGYSDSVEETWAEDGEFLQTEDYPGYEQEVPVVNSTEDSPFTTAIFYQDEEENGLTEQDTVVFGTRVKEETEGSFGSYNYEIRVPSTLKRTEGETELLEIFRELTA